MVGNLLTADTVDTASIVAEAVASGSDVLWKWNGTDASQFELAVVNSGQFATASFRPLTSGSDVSPGLRLHCTWSGGGGAALFPLSASEFTVPASGRFLVRTRITTGSNQLYHGVFVHNNVLTTTGLFGVGHGQDTNSNVGIRLDAQGSAATFPPFNFPSGTPSFPQIGTTDGTAARGSVYQYEVILRQGSGSLKPTVLLYGNAVGSNTDISLMRSVEADFTTFGSGFNGVQLTNFGLFVRSQTTGDFFVEFAELMILKHPFDR